MPMATASDTSPAKAIGQAPGAADGACRSAGWVMGAMGELAADDAYANVSKLSLKRSIWRCLAAASMKLASKLLRASV